VSPITELSLQIQSYVPYGSVICINNYVPYCSVKLRELFALGRKIDMIKHIYRYLLAFGR
jgi:hypothetical protein